MKKITATQRIILDLSFLQTLTKEQLGQGLIKKLECSGNGEVIKNIKIPCMIYFSYYKYNYEGRFIQHKLNQCIRDLTKKSNNQIPKGVYLAIESMKSQQKSWFNLTTQQLYQMQNSNSNPCHYYIIIEDIKYKNSDNLQSKKLVSQQLREEAKKYFANGDFEKAMKLYQKQINITEGYDKKKYNQKQIEQMEVISLKAKGNMLKCFVKLSKFDENLSQLAQKFSKQLVKKRNNDDLSLFLRSKVLLQRKYLSNALDLAQQLQGRGNKQGSQLVAHIQQKIKNKNKN